MRKIMAVFTATTLGTLAFASTTLNSPAQAAFHPRKITVVTTGDLLLHERMWNTAIADGKNGQWDFFPQLSGIGKIIKGADLALCHQETPLAPLGGHYTGYPVFNSPPQIVSAIKRLGFDMCDQTSNHSFDGGEAGVKRTIKEFDKAGIAHTGTYATPADSKKPLVMTVNSSTGTIKVGICAFTYGFNGFPYPNGHTWLANQTSFLKVMQGVKAVRNAGAEIVIVKLHWGTEYANYPNDNQQLLAKKIAKTGLVDLIDGDHTHSVEPMQKIGRMWVAYSHGNLVAAQPDPESIQYEGLISRWTFTEQSNHRFQVTRAEYAPTLISRHVPVRVIDVERALATGKWTGVTKSRLDKAMARTSKTILSMNAPAKLIAQ